MTIGDRQIIKATQLLDGNMISPNNWYPSPLMMIPQRIKLVTDTNKEGINDAIVLLRNNVLIETGENKRLSKVRRSFSPTKLFAATTLAVMIGTSKNNEGNK
mgnify:CR=1 FL=1